MSKITDPFESLIEPNAQLAGTGLLEWARDWMWPSALAQIIPVEGQVRAIGVFISDIRDPGFPEPPRCDWGSDRPPERGTGGEGQQPMVSFLNQAHPGV